MLRRRVVNRNVGAPVAGVVRSAQIRWISAKDSRVIMAGFVNRDPVGFVACAPKDSPALIVGST